MALILSKSSSRNLAIAIILNPLFQGAWIAYSLGNFVFDQSFSQETMEGLLLEAVIKNGKIETVNRRSIKISTDFQPYLE